MPAKPRLTKLERILQHVNGSTFITIDTITEPKLTGGKANPHQGRVTKHMTGGNVMVFTNKKKNAYEAMVMRRLEAEGKDPESFKLGPRQWGHRIEGTPFVRHGDTLYLEVIFLRPGAVHYCLDGVHVNEDDIEGLPVSGMEGEQGGLSNKVIIRTFTCSNIRKITVNRRTFVL